MALRTLAAMSGLTDRTRLKVRDTVATETPALFATSRIPRCLSRLVMTIWRWKSFPLRIPLLTYTIIYYSVFFGKGFPNYGRDALNPAQILSQGMALRIVRLFAIGAAALANLAPAQTGKPSRLLTLAPADIFVICLYFALVLGIGLYLKRRVRASNDFFFAGKGVGSWVAGLSFVAANLGTLELLGWSASAYQYGMLAAHWYWIGAVPAMLFLG